MAAPEIFCDQVFPGLIVSDIPAAVDFYINKLGFTLGFTWGDPPGFASVKLGKVEVHLLKGNPVPGVSQVYFPVDDSNALFEFHVANGVQVIVPPDDRDYDMRDYRVADLDGNHLSFGHYVQHMGEPVPIERVDVPVRLEKRIAALLQDLADHKKMSLNSCLEETLLHTFEIYGDGVASPHTRSTLAYIQELKKKHGIDYDCHASYRFVEKNS
jgi:catechol 2,3-dioxygenase-like lactoylglutathione lyase family enzyme